MSSKVPVIENRNKQFVDFVKKNTNWENYIEDLIVVNDKVFLICKGRNWEIHQLTKEVKDYATLFGLDRVFISVEHKESIQNTVIMSTDAITTSGATFTNYIVD